MTDTTHGAGGSYIRKQDGSLELAGRTEPAPMRKARELAEPSIEAVTEDAKPAPAAKKKET